MGENSNELTPQRGLDEKIRSYMRYLRYATEPKHPTKLRRRLELLGFSPEDRYCDLLSGGRGYDMHVEGGNVAVSLYPELAFIEIPYRNRIIGEDGILNLPKTDTLLLNMVEEEYERAPNKDDTRLAILAAIVTKRNPWQTLFICELVKIVVHSKYWK